MMHLAVEPVIRQASNGDRRADCKPPCSSSLLLTHARQPSQRIKRQWSQPTLHTSRIWARMASAAACPDPNQALFAAGDQLVTEIYVAQMQPSMDFFTSLGFNIERSEHGFAVLRWGPSALYLEEVPDHAPLVAGAAASGHHGQAANVRVLVPDVDAYHAKAVELGYSIIRDIKDQYYGLRDFTVAGPDGVALRFATPLAPQESLH